MTGAPKPASSGAAIIYHRDHDKRALTLERWHASLPVSTRWDKLTVPLRDVEDPGRDSVTLPPDALRGFVAAVCIRLGADKEIAEVVAEHLVRANLSGHDSHGVGRLPGYAAQAAEGLLCPCGRPSVMRRAGATALFDARCGFGHCSTRVVLDGAIRANPRAIGVPAGDAEPVTVDVSTAVVAEGKVQVARAHSGGSQACGSR